MHNRKLQEFSLFRNTCERRTNFIHSSNAEMSLDKPKHRTHWEISILSMYSSRTKPNSDITKTSFDCKQSQHLAREWISNSVVLPNGENPWNSYLCMKTSLWWRKKTSRKKELLYRSWPYFNSRCRLTDEIKEQESKHRAIRNECPLKSIFCLGRSYYVRKMDNIKLSFRC